MNLWERTKSIATMYTGTFIVVMILNQLLFFGFCLNPICLIAAMPHVLFITALVGSWLNKESGWGDEKQSGNVGKIFKESKELIDNSLSKTALDLKRANEKINKEQYYDAEFEEIDTKHLEVITPKKTVHTIDYSTCQTCGAPTVLRTAKKGKYAGKDFYGCSRFPKCNGITNIMKDNFDDDIPF